jgi:hypothetical protein
MVARLKTENAETLTQKFVSSDPSSYTAFNDGEWEGVNLIIIGNDGINPVLLRSLGA